MTLSLEQKKKSLASMVEFIQGATSVVAADYQGVEATSFTSLRNQAKTDGIKVCVIRNRLFKKAIKDTSFECMQSVCVGPTMLAFSYEEPGVGAKLFKKFAKEEDRFSIKGFAYSGSLFDSKDIDKLALLPNKEEALTKVAFVLQAPVAKFATSLNAVPVKLVNVLTALKDSKEA